MEIKRTENSKQKRHMKAVHIVIHGRVHGVGFRQFVKSNAVKLDLFGWVQNNDDRTVEALFQGKEKAVEKIIALCHTGPMLSDIQKVDVNHMDELFPYTEFEVL